MFVIFNTSKPKMAKLKESLGIPVGEDVPRLWVVHFMKRTMRYSGPKGDLTPENLKSFLNDYLNGKVEQ